MWQQGPKAKRKYHRALWKQLSSIYYFLKIINKINILWWQTSIWHNNNNKNHSWEWIRSWISCKLSFYHRSHIIHVLYSCILWIHPFLCSFIAIFLHIIIQAVNYVSRSIFGTGFLFGKVLIIFYMLHQMLPLVVPLTLVIHYGVLWNSLECRTLETRVIVTRVARWQENRRI